MFGREELHYNAYEEETIYELHFQKPLVVRDFVSAACEEENGWLRIYLVEGWFGRWNPTKPKQICECYYGSITLLGDFEEIADRTVSRATLESGWGPKKYFISLESDAMGGCAE